MLTYLSGIGATRPAARQAKKAAKQAQKTAIVKAKIERKAIKQDARQQRLTSAGKFVAPIAKKTPAGLVATRIKKAQVEGQKRAAFKRAGEPLAVSPSEIFAEPQEIQNADVEFQEGEQEIDQPEFNNNDMQDEMGIIYPGYGAVKKSNKKAAAKPAKKQVSPEVKAKRQAAIKKVSAQVMNVAKATLEAKGIKFPTKDQIEKQAEEIAPAEKKSYTMPLLIGGGALALFLILKKK
jgi:hypothetical protein